MTRPPRRPRPDDAHGARTGTRGETLAAAALARIGFVVAARNVRTRGGEIDLLVRRGRLWIAVEVKELLPRAPDAR